MDEHSNLGAESEESLRLLVDGGQFATRDDVLREGVRLVRDRVALRAAVQAGIDDADAGRVMDVDEAFDRLDLHIRELAAQDHDAQVAKIKSAVARGIADADAGRVVDAKEGFAELEQYFRALGTGEPK